MVFLQPFGRTDRQVFRPHLVGEPSASALLLTMSECSYFMGVTSSQVMRSGLHTTTRVR